MSHLRSTLPALGLLALLALAAPPTRAAEALALPLDADPGRIRAHMTFLADDG